MSSSSIIALMCLPQTNRNKLPSAAKCGISNLAAVYQVSAPGERARASVLRILTAACASRVCNRSSTIYACVLYYMVYVLAGVYE